MGEGEQSAQVPRRVGGASTHLDVSPSILLRRRVQPHVMAFRSNPSLPSKLCLFALLSATHPSAIKVSVREGKNEAASNGHDYISAFPAHQEPIQLMSAPGLQIKLVSCGCCSWCFELIAHAVSWTQLRERRPLPQPGIYGIVEITRRLSSWQAGV